MNGKFDLLEAEWDNLFILDACRYDTYRKYTGRDCNYRITKGSNSAEFLEKNFSGKKLDNIIYITGNPHAHASQFEKETGQKAEDIFFKVNHTYVSHWDEEHHTVMPGSLMAKFKEFREEYPDKRIIVHFMQPHYPFIDSDFDFMEENVWRAVENGNVDGEQARKAYRMNLAFVYDFLKSKVPQIKGKNVITADHGNLLGEHLLWGHPEKGLEYEAVRKVPWDEF